MEKLRVAMDFCIRHQIILGYSTVSLLTAATEHIFSSVVFNCPCNSWNMLYGSSFLLAPAFILLLFGCMVNTRLWHLLTGKHSLEKCHQCCSSGTCACFGQQCVPITAKVLVAPFTWIAVALLGADFYECAVSGSSLMVRLFCKDNGNYCQNQMFKMPCDKNVSAQLSGEWLSPKAQSQLIGWLVIASISTLALISKCVSRCCSPVSYPQLKFWKIYSEKEHECFENKAKEHATQLAERNTKCFFEATDPAPLHIPSNEDWQEISFLHTFNSEEKYYGVLHKYASTNRGNSTSFKEEESHHLCTDEAKTKVAGLG